MFYFNTVREHKTTGTILIKAHEFLKSRKVREKIMRNSEKSGKGSLKRSHSKRIIAISLIGG